MKLLFKGVVVALGLVLIGISVGVLLLSSGAVNIAGRRVERTLTRTFLSRVTVEGVRVRPLRPGIEIVGLTLLNPPPFREEPAVRFGRILVDVEPASLLADTPVVARVVLRDTHANLQYKAGHGSNLAKLARFASRGAEDAAASDQPAPDDRTFRIGSIKCEEATVSLSANVVPGAALNMRLAAFRLENLDEPVTTGQVSAIVLRSILGEVLTLKGLLRPVAEQLKEEFGEMTRGAAQAS